jgi:diaminopimelate epimerase
VDPVTNLVERIRVNMGGAILSATDSAHFQTTLPEMVNYPVEIDGKAVEITFVSMGNPHAVIFMEDIDSLEIEKMGPKIEHHPLFPERTNTEFIEITDRAHLRMRVWERGSGETLACGSGACASVVAGAVTGRTDPRATVQLKGGVLEVEWDRDLNRVYLTGDAHFVFKGEV